MNPPRNRVLIVDDSAFMRIALRRIVESETGLVVVGEARDGGEAIAMVQALRPDIVTMDIAMAGIDGLAATRAILSAPPPHPVVIMVSNLTQDGAAATVEALHLGAVDFVSKSSAMAPQDLGHVDQQLRTKLRFWAAQTRQPQTPIKPDLAVRGLEPEAANFRIDLVVIAASTGGPKVLGALLLAAGKLAAPVVIAQHMPARFTASLAAVLRTETGLDVMEGTHRMLLRPGVVAIIPGGADALVGPGARVEGAETLDLRLTTSEATVHPSADVLFGSAALVARHPAAVILTGMGEDGTAGARKFRVRGLPVLVQDPESCIVDGMPRAALAAGVASASLSIAGIGQRLAQWARPLDVMRGQVVQQEQ